MKKLILTSVFFFGSLAYGEFTILQNETVPVSVGKSYIKIVMKSDFQVTKIHFDHEAVTISRLEDKLATECNKSASLNKGSYDIIDTDVFLDTNKKIIGSIKAKCMY